MECRLTSTAAGVLGALGILVLMMGPETAQAKLTAPSTGKINGSAPFVKSGALFVQTPDNNTLLNNATVNGAWVPANFTVSADTTDLTLGDLDGDCGVPMNISGVPTGANLCTATVIAASATKVWKYNNVALTAAQLTAPFSTNFASKSLTVSVSAPVTVTSPTGAPTTSTAPQTVSSAVYTVRVPAPTPIIGVNGTSFTWAAATAGGFPKTAFQGARFQFYMNGKDAVGNADYTFTSSQPGWASVGANTGVVTFTRMPAASEKTVSVTITDNRGSGATRSYEFTAAVWFISNDNLVNGNSRAYFDAYCAAFGAGWTMPTENFLRTAAGNYTGVRGVFGTLYGEWGNPQLFGASAPGWGPKGTAYFASWLADGPPAIAQKIYNTRYGALDDSRGSTDRWGWPTYGQMCQIVL